MSDNVGNANIILLRRYKYYSSVLLQLQGPRGMDGPNGTSREQLKILCALQLKILVTGVGDALWWLSSQHYSPRFLLRTRKPESELGELLFFSDKHLGSCACPTRTVPCHFLVFTSIYPFCRTMFTSQAIKHPELKVH